MARYIDADALIENVKRVYCTDCNNYNEVRCRACGTDDALDMIEDAPTADVVPKSEVEKLQEAYNDRLAKDIQTNAEFVKHAKAEVAREIFEEIDSLLKIFCDEPLYSSDDLVCDIADLVYDIAELKKKYTEGH